MATKLRLKMLSLACSRASFLLACGMSAALACSSDGGRRDDEPGSDQTVVEIETGSIQLPLTTRGASGALYRLRNAVFQVEQLSGDPFPDVPPPDQPSEPPVFPPPFPQPPIFIEEDDIGVAGSGATAGAGNFDVPPDGIGGWDGSSPPSMGGSSAGGSGPVGTGGTVGTAGSPGTGGFAGSGVAGAAGAAGAGGFDTGGSGGAPSGFVTLLFSEDDPFATTLETTLPVGRYLITLLEGWSLERVFGSDVTVVDATLESSAAQEFSIFVNEESFVFYSFSTNGEIVSFGDGRLIVDIEVNENPGGGGDDPRLTVMENAREALPFSLEEALGAALANAGSSLDALSAYHGIVDSYATAASGRDPGLAHCDDEQTGGGPSLNGFPLQCGRLEAEQFDNLGAWFPIGASNRLDLAPADGANCGQQRLIFANNTFIGNGRMFIIMEATVPNPDPGCGVAACAPVASFWTNLAAITDPIERGNRLREAFLTGSPELLAAGFAPFMNAQHLGPDGGQIRTNNFNDSPWTLREFHFVDIEQPPLPQPVAESPNGELWNDLSPLPQGEACRESFLRAASLGLAASELNALSFPVDQACKDAESRNDFSEDYGFHLSQGSGEFRARLDEIGAPLGLTAEDLAARARFGGACMGCHQEASGSSLGNGLTAPFQFDFVHVSEFGQEQCGNGGTCFGISEALRGSFLPTRARITRNLAGFPACGGEPPPIDPIPGDPGDGADGGVSSPGSLPARTVAPGSGVRFTLGGQVADGHAH
jgi:hypothetical protein